MKYDLNNNEKRGEECEDWRRWYCWCERAEQRQFVNSCWDCVVVIDDPHTRRD
jgi:hypothetical protein